jgi:hypothetical protein
MELLQKIRREYAGERLMVAITVEDLNELISRKTGLSLAAVDTAPDLYSQISTELAQLAKLRHEYLVRNPQVEIMPMPREPQDGQDDRQDGQDDRPDGFN